MKTRPNSPAPLFARPCCLRPVGAFLLFGGVALVLPLAIRAQYPTQNPLIPALNAEQPSAGKHAKRIKLSTPETQPNLTIPVTPLGFASPASFYLGDRLSQVSLNFLDEDTLLFTFRVPGLIAREQPTPDHVDTSDGSHEERHIRALVLSLPSGKVTAEGLWRLHDYAQYLWMLKDHRFLLRDRNLIQTGDASLHLEPFLRFPGPIRYLELDPDQRLLITNTSEPPAKQAVADSDGRPTLYARNAGPDPTSQAVQPDTAAAGMVNRDTHYGAQADPAPDPEYQSLLRVLRMDSRQVMLFSRVNGIVHLPVDGEGYYEALRGSGLNWLISYHNFTGESTPLLEVESTCNPPLDIPSPGFLLVSACNDTGGRRLIAFHRSPDTGRSLAQALNQRPLWDISIPPTRVWPLLAHSDDSLRFVRATLEVTHAVGPASPLDRTDIRGQNIQVYDVATGKSPLAVFVNPPFDAGGNFALSPSGNRLAVLNGGSIQIFDLPPAAPFPPPPSAKP